MERSVAVLYDDPYYLIVDKPTRMLVVPTPRGEKNTLSVVLGKMLGYAVFPCHRLDYETSGVVVLAKGPEHQRMLMEEFKAQRVRKKYIALVRGRMEKPDGEIKSFIRDFHQKKFRQCAQGKLAVTLFKVKFLRKNYSVVEVWPKTGRTNQIRIHFREIGHPLLGERVYAFRKDFVVDFKRLGLHAAEICFRHPVNGEQIKIKSDLPQDMVEFLRHHH